MFECFLVAYGFFKSAICGKSELIYVFRSLPHRATVYMQKQESPPGIIPFFSE